MLKIIIYTGNLENTGFFFLLHLTNKNGVLFYTLPPFCNGISHSLLLQLLIKILGSSLLFPFCR